MVLKGTAQADHLCISEEPVAGSTHQTVLRLVWDGAQGSPQAFKSTSDDSNIHLRLKSLGFDLKFMLIH